MAQGRGNPVSVEDQVIHEPRLAESDLHLEPRLVRFVVNNRFLRSFAYLFGYYQAGDVYRRIRCTSDGVLHVTTAPVARATADVHQHALVATAVEILEVNADRACVSVKNHSAEKVYVGFDNTVSDSTGRLLEENASIEMDLYTGAVWAISTVTGSSVSVIEL